MLHIAKRLTQMVRETSLGPPQNVHNCAFRSFGLVLVKGNDQHRVRYTAAESLRSAFSNAKAADTCGSAPILHLLGTFFGARARIFLCTHGPELVPWRSPRSEASPAQDSQWDVLFD